MILIVDWFLPTGDRTAGEELPAHLVPARNAGDQFCIRHDAVTKDAS